LTGGAFHGVPAQRVGSKSESPLEAGGGLMDRLFDLPGSLEGSQSPANDSSLCLHMQHCPLLGVLVVLNSCGTAKWRSVGSVLFTLFIY
jgi:hypothetical protein